MNEPVGESSFITQLINGGVLVISYNLVNVEFFFLSWDFLCHQVASFWEEQTSGFMLEVVFRCSSLCPFFHYTGTRVYIQPNSFCDRTLLEVF